MAISANITIPAKGNSVAVSQNTQSVSVTKSAPNQVTVVERGSFSDSSFSADKHKTLTINVNDWTANGSEYEAVYAHNLDKRPSVVVVDSFGQTQYPDIEYIDDNSVRLVVRGQFSGKVHFN